MITPSLIFFMLFFTFCRVDVRRMRLQPIHFWLLAAQLLFSIAVYGILYPFNEVVAQGGMICVLTPIAMAAVVIGGMLGADVVTMTTFSLLCNMVIALVAPVFLSLVGNGECSLGLILARVAPLLILPFATAQVCRVALPRVSNWVAEHSQISLPSACPASRFEATPITLPISFMEVAPTSAIIAFTASASSSAVS